MEFMDEQNFRVPAGMKDQYTIIWGGTCVAEYLCGVGNTN